MIKQLRVTNLKAINDSGLLPLQPLTVFIGRNGSGKSSLIEALDWLGRALNEGAQTATEPFQRITDLMRGWSEDPENSISISIVVDPEDLSMGSEILYQVRIGVQPGSLLPGIIFEQLSYQSREIQEFVIKTEGSNRFRKSIAEQDREWVVISDPDRIALTDLDPVRNPQGAFIRNLLERAVFLRLNPRAIASFTPARVKPSPRIIDDEGQQLAYLLSQLDPETLEILVDRLNYVIQGTQSIDNHEPASPGDRRYLTFIESRSGEDKQLQVPAWMLSEGIRRVTAILAVLYHENPPKLLCIEEIENGLDPWTLGFVLEELRQAVDRGTQILLTSHSPYMLNMVAKENIILCERKPYGIEFYPPDKLPDMDHLQTMLGVGSLYANKALYPKQQNEE